MVVGGFGNEGRLWFEGGAGGLSSSVDRPNGDNKQDMKKFVDRAINAIIVLAVGFFPITKLFTID